MKSSRAIWPVVCFNNHVGVGLVFNECVSRHGFRSPRRSPWASFFCPLLDVIIAGLEMLGELNETHAAILVLSAMNKCGSPDVYVGAYRLLVRRAHGLPDPRFPGIPKFIPGWRAWYEVLVRLAPTRRLRAWCQRQISVHINAALPMHDTKDYQN